MKFTLVFPSNESADISVGLVFIPCAAWSIAGRIFHNPHPSNPHYLPGDLNELINVFVRRGVLNENWISDFAGNDLHIIVHNIGHGTDVYLEQLIDDILNLGLIPKVIQ